MENNNSLWICLKINKNVFYLCVISLVGTQPILDMYETYLYFQVSRMLLRAFTKKFGHSNNFFDSISSSC